eukprot:2241147-Pleurochrysis_carterae.AAC.6
MHVTPQASARHGLHAVNAAGALLVSPPHGPSFFLVAFEVQSVAQPVELKLLTEVSSRAEGFFEALVSYDKLTQEVSAGVATIGAMRAKLRLLETNLVDKSLVLPRLARRRANSEALLEKLRLVHAVWRTQPTIAQLLTSGDFPNALELIASSQSLLATGARAPHTHTQTRHAHTGRSEASLVPYKATSHDRARVLDKGARAGERERARARDLCFLISRAEMFVQAGRAEDKLQPCCPISASPVSLAHAALFDLLLKVALSTRRCG